MIGETEYQFWSAPERLSGPTEGPAKLVASNVTPLKDKMSFIKDGAEVAGGIRAMAAFGHTPGHMAFHIESGGKRLLLGADFCNHYVLSLQRPDWEVRFDADKAKAAETRKKLLDMLAADRIPFTSYHMPFPARGLCGDLQRGRIPLRAGNLPDADLIRLHLPVSNAAAAAPARRCAGGCRRVELLAQFAEAALQIVDLAPLRDDHLVEVGDHPVLLGDAQLELGDAVGRTGHADHSHSIVPGGLLVTS